MKIIDFLKRYTNIDHKFIEDFYVFYDENKSDYDFVIRGNSNFNIFIFDTC